MHRTVWGLGALAITVACGGLATEGTGGPLDAAAEGGLDDAVAGDESSDGTAGSAGTGGSGGVGGGSGAGGSAGTDGTGGSGGSGGTAGSTGGRVSCHELAGKGSTRTCGFVSTNAPGYMCPRNEFSASGSCPSAGLYGCCVSTVVSGGYVSISAACVYEAGAASALRKACRDRNEKWSTSPP